MASTARPSRQAVAIDDLIIGLETIHCRPRAADVLAVIGAEPLAADVAAMLAPFFPRWRGDASEPALPSPPTQPVNGGALAGVDLLDMALHHRDLLEAAIEAMISALDVVDGDLEAACDDEGYDGDREPDCDAEPDDAECERNMPEWVSA